MTKKAGQTSKALSINDLYITNPSSIEGLRPDDTENDSETQAEADGCGEGPECD